MKSARFLGILFLILTFSVLKSQTPGFISYQGKLTDSNGDALDGSYALTFSLYDSESATTPLWIEVHSSVPVTEGLFQVKLGSVEAFPKDLFDANTDLFLGIRVGTENEMTPRFQFGNVAYAFKSAHSDSAAKAAMASPSGPAGGDLSGDYPDPAVTALQGNAVSNTSPSTDQVLKWNGTAWTPATDAAGGTVATASRLTGDGTAGDPLDIAQQGAQVNNVLKWDGNSWTPAVDETGGGQTVNTDATIDGDGTLSLPLKIAQQGATNNQVLKWDGSTWQPAPDDTGSGGAVSTTARLIGDGSAGDPLDIAQQGAASDQVLKWDGSAWTPAADETTPSGTAGGDLAGSYPNPTVAGLSGRTVATTAPSLNNVLKWDGNAWAPAVDETGGGQTVNTDATIDGDGTLSTPLKIAQQGATTNQVLKWNGSSWVPAADETGSGQTVNTDATIDGDGSVTTPLKIAQQGATSSQVLKWNGSTWAPATDATGGTPSGTAGGDLNGTYPNPGVDAIQGYAVAATTPGTNQVLKWTGSAWAPATISTVGNTLDQAYDQGGAGAGRTITADNGAVNINGTDGLTVNTSVTAGSFAGNGTLLTGLNANNLTSGSVPLGRLDTDLQDLADGSLTGSKVGTGINGSNITTGTVADERLEDVITRTGFSASGYLSALGGVRVGNTNDPSGNLWVDNFVGIGTTSSPGFPLQMYSENAGRSLSIDHNVTASGTNYALFVDMDNTYTGSSSNYGAYINANNDGGSYSTYGLYGRAGGTSIGNKYGVYGYATGSGNLYAGFFNGNTYADRIGIGNNGVNPPFYPLHINAGTESRAIYIDHDQTGSAHTYSLYLELDNTYTGNSDNTGAHIYVTNDGGASSTIGVNSTVEGTSTGSNYGVRGRAFGAGTRYGVYGYASLTDYPTRYGIYGSCGVASGTDANYAARFFGNTLTSGSSTKSSERTQIDHPLDPENKYLNHSGVDSDDRLNIYNGNVTLGTNGEAWVQLPEWFEAYNKEFRYQLTCIGGFAQVYIAEKVKGNRFKIAGGKSGMEVSWQITGIRKDMLAEKNKIEVEQMKSIEDQGKYVNPEAFGLSSEEAIGYEDNIEPDEPKDLNQNIIIENEPEEMPEDINP